LVSRASRPHRQPTALSGDLSRPDGADRPRRRHVARASLPFGREPCARNLNVKKGDLASEVILLQTSEVINPIADFIRILDADNPE
jgi:hypothetical protein